ncbi:hypothetical protein E2C01_020816 [Portunus trituberculatus]|uniref:Uncharacterized protein n=1 Tax=Portunus trituberculatus TaxID=210409 RepID=A0A5B7E0Y1_PORTR|nr:hypothetical protein [Portunus trituberculatus]
MNGVRRLRVWGATCSRGGADAQCHRGPARGIEAITPLPDITMGPAVPERAQTGPSAMTDLSVASLAALRITTPLMRTSGLGRIVIVVHFPDSS